MGQDPSQDHIHAESYLCKATYANTVYFGRTFTGVIPSGARGDYCKITYRNGSGSAASYKYRPTSSVYLNNRPNQTGAVVFAGSTFNGDLIRPQPGTMMRSHGIVLGMKYPGESGFRAPEAGTGLGRYLFTRM